MLCKKHKNIFCTCSTIKVDEFTRRLWNIYETVRKEGITQVTFLILFMFASTCTCGLNGTVLGWDKLANII